MSTTLVSFTLTAHTLVSHLESQSLSQPLYVTGCRRSNLRIAFSFPHPVCATMLVSSAVRKPAARCRPTNGPTKLPSIFQTQLHGSYSFPPPGGAASHAPLQLCYLLVDIRNSYIVI